MRIINGKKFYKRDIDAAVKLNFDGWDRDNGQDKQWYSVCYNPDCGLTILCANNSGSCYGDYKDRYFDSPASFKKWAVMKNRDIEELIGDVDESDELAMKFVRELFPD